MDAKQVARDTQLLAECLTRVLPTRKILVDAKQAARDTQMLAECLTRVFPTRENLVMPVPVGTPLKS